MNSLTSSSSHAQDQIFQGRMILVGISASYYILWVLDFVINPVVLVPGFVLDHSLATAMVLLGFLVRYGIFSLGLLLVWAGVGWVRYLLAAYLLLAGLFAVVLSIQLGGFGGVPLILGSVELVSAVALAMSLSVLRFMEDRQRRDVPWLALALAGLSLIAIPIGASLYDVAFAFLALHREQRATASASALFQEFAVDLDPHVIETSAAGNLKENFANPGFADQFKDFREGVGALRSLDLPPPPSLEQVTLDPISGPGRAYNATAHYAHGDVVISLQADLSGTQPVFTDLFVQQTSVLPAKNK